ncbi:hypothetical protein RRG08_008561, partial [Elysia crispata]
NFALDVSKMWDLV